MVVERKERVIQQTCMTLPYFDYKVPVLYPEDGRPYVPVMVLCTMLGLHAFLAGGGSSSGGMHASYQCVLHPGASALFGALPF